MRTKIVLGLLLLSASLTGTGCQQPRTVEQELPPPPPPKVQVDLPDGNLARDEEGVRRIGVVLTWERQQTGPKVLRGFSVDGRVEDLELTPPLDQVLQRHLEAAFKELGFNVTSAGTLDPTSAAVVRTELERVGADYLVVPYVNEFTISTIAAPNAPAFATVSMEIQLYGRGGGLVTASLLEVRKGWSLTGGAPGPEQARTCVEDLLKDIRRRVTRDPGFLQALGLELPAAAAAQP